MSDDDGGGWTIAPQARKTTTAAATQGQRAMSAAPAPGALVELEAQLSAQLLQVAYLHAERKPRDEDRALERVLADCRHPALAERAMYDYARGGSEITGASIHLIEAIRRRWGNIWAGWNEVARHEGYSECLIFAVDLEQGGGEPRTVVVRHWRDTKSGGFPLRDQRDITEHVANVCQRRKRTMVEALLPDHVVAAAQGEVVETMRTAADLTPEGFAKLLAAFAEFGVTRAQIEQRIQRNLEAMTATHWGMLKATYRRLRDGLGVVSDYFETAAPGTPPAAAPTGAAAAAARESVSATQRAKETIRARSKGKPKGDDEGDPFASAEAVQPQGEPGAGAADESTVTLVELRNAVLSAKSRDDAELVLDLARSLPTEEQQALRLVFDQRYSPEGGGA